MKIILILFFFFLTQVVSTLTYAKSGSSLVGNGAGIIENSFTYYYSQLKSLIQDFLDQHNHPTNSLNTDLLVKIQNVLEKNFDPSLNLVFISGKLNAGFFQTAGNEPHRIAKTFLDVKSPIFVNTDLLYKINGETAIDDGAIVSILIHELGHQAGEENHQKLDMIGNLVRKSLKDKITSSYLKDTADNKEIKLTTVHLQIGRAHV